MVLRDVRKAIRRENNSQGRLHYRWRNFSAAEKKFSDDTSDWSVSGKQLGPAQHVGPASRCYHSRDAWLELPQHNSVQFSSSSKTKPKYPVQSWTVQRRTV